MKAQDRINVEIANFPATFGLRAYPGQRFRIGTRQSYVNDAGEIMLYTQVQRGKYWLDFAKGSPSELRAQVAPEPCPVCASVIARSARRILHDSKLCENGRGPLDTYRFDFVHGTKNTTLIVWHRGTEYAAAEQVRADFSEEKEAWAAVPLDELSTRFPAQHLGFSKAESTEDVEDDNWFMRLARLLIALWRPGVGLQKTAMHKPLFVSPDGAATFEVRSGEWMDSVIRAFAWAAA